MKLRIDWIIRLRATKVKRVCSLVIRSSSRCAVLLLDVGQAVEFLRQRAQRLGQQADGAALTVSSPVLVLNMVPSHADDVAEVPALEACA
jgi:hypothetical protein